MSRISAGLVILIVASLACTFVIPSTSGSGPLTTITEDLVDFSRVEVGSAFSANIRRADEYSVVIYVDESLRRLLRVRVVGEELRIGLEPLVPFFGEGTLHAEIAMPALERLEVSGASRVEITGFDGGDPFQATVSGASSLRGDLVAGDVRLEASGASTLDLTGAGGSLRLDLSGASRAELASFTVGDASVTLSGASRATVHSVGRLDVDASGASELGYLGNPTMGDVDLSGGSSIEPGSP